MAVNVVLNGVSYSIPDPGDNGWGQDLTDYLVAQASGLLQKAGGSFTLTAEVDFGATFGLKSAYFKSRGTNPSTAGVLRLANAESISWRNAANGANLALLVNSSNQLEFNGTVIQSALSVSDTSTIDLTLAGSVLSGIVVDASITNAKLATMATQTFKGRTTAGTGAPEDLTATQATAMLNAMVGDSGSGGTKGLVPAPGVGDATKVLSGAGTYITPGTGTVTSVAMTVPTALFAASPVTGSPVTTTGTLAPTLATQTANRVFAGPTTGSAATPTFRALVNADIPNVGYSAQGDASYSVAATDYVVSGTPSVARTFTLPTAVGVSGKEYTLQMLSGAGTIPIATTSSQTIGGRASSDIVLAAPGDFVKVISDNANWQITGKKETKVYVVSSSAKSLTGISNQSYLQMTSNSVSLGIGQWRVTGWIRYYNSNTASVEVGSNSGFYAANGTDANLQPTQLSGVTSASALFINLIGTPISNIPVNTQFTTPISMVLTNSTSQTVFLVPRSGGTPATGSEMQVAFTAERIW